MNKYECSACKREIVTNSKADTLSMACCKGDSPVTFKKVGTAIIVPAAKLPSENLKPIPAGTVSKPAPVQGEVAPKGIIIPAK